MAKHNLFLGTGSGSVGDVVVMRREGVQVQRVRVREIANPKTIGQASQRNFLAPVAKFYAPFTVALEKSWEGLNKSKSYSAFLKKNIERARVNGYYLPKGQAFFPMPYQLSNGTLPSIRAHMGSSVFEDSYLCLDFNPTQSGAFSDFSDAMIQKYGLQNGDQITFIAIAQVDSDVYIPLYYRFFLDVDSAAQTSSVFNSAPFAWEIRNYVAFRSKNANNPFVAGAFIASRWENEKWRRSVEMLSCSQAILSAITGDAAAAAAIDSYRDSATANASDVYLNGSNG